MPDSPSYADLIVGALELQHRANSMEPPGDLAPAYRRVAAFLEEQAEIVADEEPTAQELAQQRKLLARARALEASKSKKW